MGIGIPDRNLFLRFGLLGALSASIGLFVTWVLLVVYGNCVLCIAHIARRYPLVIGVGPSDPFDEVLQLSLRRLGVQNMLNFLFIGTVNFEGPGLRGLVALPAFKWLQ